MSRIGLRFLPGDVARDRYLTDNHAAMAGPWFDEALVLGMQPADLVTALGLDFRWPDGSHRFNAADLAVIRFEVTNPVLLASVVSCCRLVSGELPVPAGRSWTGNGFAPAPRRAVPEYRLSAIPIPSGATLCEVTVSGQLNAVARRLGEHWA